MATITNEITFESLCEEIPDEQRAWLDRAVAIVDGRQPDSPLDIRAQPGWVIELTKRYQHWRDNGYLTLRNFIPPALIDAYVARYERDNGKDSPVGYPTGTPYMQVDEIKNLSLYAPLMKILNGLIGEPMGMSLNLCNWISTERNWHQDDYLNPPEVNGHYLACWFALDDIHPDSGVFEFVPGSHKWPVMRGEKVRQLLEPHERNDPNWPRTAERFLDEVFERKIIEEYKKNRQVAYEKAKEEAGDGWPCFEIDSPIKRWSDAKKGDVLIWHSWLAHRGSKPKTQGMLRKSLITHYSGINHRPDMQKPLLWENGESKGYYFPF